MITLAEQLIKSLYAVGVKRVFGIPGGPSIPYMEAMRSNGIEFVLVSNEQSAAIMADITGRLTGVPGVCHATFGPGATNLSTGVGGAFLDRSPLIALTTEVKDEDVGRRIQMNIDHQALYKPITKWTARLTENRFKDTLSSALNIAVSEVPGPVHIGLPSNIDSVMLTSNTLVDAYEITPAPLPDPSLLQKAEKVIKNAKKPVLAIGLTASRLGLCKPIREFVSKNNIPVVLTPMAKGIIPDDHPCYAGVLFHSCSNIVAGVYRQADLVIGAGYDTIEFNYESWMPGVPLVHMDTVPADIPGDYEVACDIPGDLATSVEYLHSLQLPVYDWDLEKVKENKNQLFQALMLRTQTFTPAKLLNILREALPEDGIITGDVGAHLHLMGQLWKVNEPNRFIITNGWSAMGFGIPAAIGAKLCEPDKHVVCITGDGGFLMNCGELMTARRLGINIVVIVICDGDLSLIKVKQGWKDVSMYKTDLYLGEYFYAEKFLGVPVFKVSNESEMKAALQKVFSVPGPVIIEALVDGSEYNNLITRSYK